MKIGLIALAVLAASGASFAQSGVTVYGVVDVYLGRIKGATTQTAVDAGGISSNRFGFKGSEDLGGGLKANFVLEQGFSVDTGAAKTAGEMFARQSYFGFSGGFGELKIGKMYSAYDDINGAGNAVFDSALTPQNNVWKSVGYQSNPYNGAYYATPSFSGFSGAYSRNAGEGKVGVVQSAHIKYEAGPLFAGVAYQSEDAFGTTTAAQNFTRVNASYDFGVAKVLVGLGRVQAPVGARTNEWGVGMDYLLSSALTVSGGYARSHDNAAVVGGGVRKGYGLAASYSLSNRTSVYSGYQSNTTTTAGVDADASLLAVGVRHAF